MTRRGVAVACVAALLAGAAPSGAEHRPGGGARPGAVRGGSLPAWREGEALVRLKPGAGVEELAPAVAALSATRELERELAPLSRDGGAQLLVRAAGRSTAALLAALAGEPAVDAVQPNWILSAAALPDDPLLPLQWPLRNTGQAIHGFAGSAGSDVGAEAAWGVAAGTGAVIAVVDSGVDTTHEELAAALWTNPGEIAGDGLDNDGNGWVDDLHGIDATGYGSGDPTDLNGHGTHVAGTVAAAAGNVRGVAGLAPETRVMALRFLGANGSGTTADAVRCILYAVRMRREFGVNVVAINASWGNVSGMEGDLLSRAIRLAGQAGIVFVAAAGNGGIDNDVPEQFPYFPASYAAPTIVSVAATDARDQLPAWSNTGSASVDLAAPGVEVLSTLPGGNDASLFFEDFEAGDGAWEHGGTFDLWAVTAGDAVSGGHALEDSPGIPYRPDTASWAGINRDLDLSGVAGEDVRLSLWAKVDLEGFGGAQDFDYVLPSFSGDGGLTWVFTATPTKITGPLRGWRMYDVAVPAAVRTANFRFRLNLTSDEIFQFEGIAVDDVALGVHRGGAGYGFLSGTSMAAPHVSAALALIASRFGGEDAATRIRRLLSGAEEVPALAGRVATGGRLDAAAALRDDLPLAPLVTGVSPWQGVAPGAVLTISGAGFGTAPGAVRFGAVPDPAWEPADGLRLRFRLLVGGIPGYKHSYGDGVHLDDVAVEAGGATLFADDLEGGDALWEHGGDRDAWGLTGETAHSPGTSWADSPGFSAEEGTHSWLRAVPTLAPGGRAARLRFFAKIDLDDYYGETLWPEASTDGGAAWHALAALTGLGGDWSRFELAVPPAGAAGTVLSWTETQVRVRVPAGAGRQLMLVRADGVAAPVASPLRGWLAGASPRELRSQGAAAVLGGKLLFCGGVTARPGPTYPYSATCEAWDPQRGWAAAPPMAQNRAAFVAGEIGGRLYVAGGYGMVWNAIFGEYAGGAVRSVEVYDPARGRWRRRASLPQAVSGAAGAALGGLLWVTGGIVDGGSSPRAAVLAYDPARDRWARRAPLPSPRRLHAAAAVGGRLCVFGGWDAANRPLTSCLCLDPGTGVWSPIADLPRPLAGQAAAVYGGKLWLAGGVDATRSTRSLLVYDPAADAWEDRGGSLAEPTATRAGSSLAAVPGVGLAHLGGTAFYELSAGMELLARPARSRVVLHEPAGGGVFDAGSAVTIRWSAPKAARRFDLSWSADRGRTWRRIATGVAGDSFAWRVPWLRGNFAGCLVRVTARGSRGAVIGTDRSRQAFGIRAVELPAPLVAWVAVRGSDQWYWGQLVQVYWTSHVAAPPAAAALELSLDDGASWSAIAGLEGDPGYFGHTVLAMGEPRERCRVRVTLRSAAGALAAQAVSPRFTIDYQSQIPLRGARP